MLKPNLGELSSLCGSKNPISAIELENTCPKKFLNEHDCEILVVSLGAKGALLATKNLMEHISRTHCSAKKVHCERVIAW